MSDSEFPDSWKPKEFEEDFSTYMLIHGDDHVDAFVDDHDDLADASVDSQESVKILDNFSSQTPISGGDILKTVPKHETGGDVLKELPSKLNSASSHSNKTNKDHFVFSKDKVSPAVKHFVIDELKRKRLDVVDALGDGQDDLPSFVTCGHTVLPRQYVRQETTVEEEFCYPMEHKQRGCFVIFNQKNFHHYNVKYNKDKPEAEHVKIRFGTEKDAHNLAYAATCLGFEHVRIINDSTKQEIFNMITRLSNADHSDYDCFACAILTHGGDKDILYACDETFKLKEITRLLGADLCPTLAGKPKLFFIQACRGFKLDHGQKMSKLSASDAVDGPIPSNSNHPEPTVGDDKNPKVISIPTEADFLIANSTVQDYYAWRNESNGSWFIQSLCSIFIMYGHRWELMRMMTRVNRMVAYDYASASLNEKMNEKKQIPSIATRLTAEVFFRPKHSAVQENQTVTNTRATVSPPTSSQLIYQRREMRSGMAYQKKEEITITSTNPQMTHLFPSGDSGQESPQTSSADTFLFPSPKSVADPKATISPAQSTEFLPANHRSFNFPHSQSSIQLSQSPCNTPRKLSSPVPTTLPASPMPRKGSFVATSTLSQSWDTNSNNSFSSFLHSHLPTGIRRSSFSISKRSLKKGVKQTHL